MRKATWANYRGGSGGSAPSCPCTDSNESQNAATGMSKFVYDAAVLVAADRNDRRTWAEHKIRLQLGLLPLVPAPVVAQVSRAPQQVQLRRFLAGCLVLPLGESEAHEAGRLLARTKTADVVHAVVVTAALRNNAAILTSDTEDIGRLVGASGGEIAVITV